MTFKPINPKGKTRPRSGSVFPSLLLLLGLLIAGPASADTAGPSPSGTQAEVDGPGAAAWLTESNAASSNNSYATSAMFSGEASNILRLTNFGFTIPNATIDGITVIVERMGGSSFTDYHIQLTSGGSGVGDDKASGDTWPGSDGNKTYGGAADTWTASLDYNDINASDFGIDISCQRPSGGGLDTCSVDYASVTITYTINLYCGDGIITEADDETCDDGNADTGDGCSDVCVVEDGYQCVDEPSSCSLIPGDVEKTAVGIIAGLSPFVVFGVFCAACWGWPIKRRR